MTAAFSRYQLMITRLLIVTLFFSITISDASKANEPDTFDYKNHPCKRSCKEGEAPKICQYIFVVERYTTMSKACYDCPHNATDCFRPHCLVADGVPKAVYSVNRQVPGPTIDVELRNKMLSESTTLHWHGFKQLHTNYMDGVPYVTQCPILPSQNFVYKFHATSTGTFFYHSHIGNQKNDGLFGALVVRKITENKTIKELNIHDEHIVVVNDWSYKSDAENFIQNSYIRAPILMDTLLVNGLGRKNWTTSGRTEYTPTAEFTVTKGKNYRFRVVGAASQDCPIRMTIDHHEMKIISLDSNNIEPIIVDALMIWPGERIDFVLTANQKADNYWIRFVGDVFCQPNGHQLAILRYDSVVTSKHEKLVDPNTAETNLTPRVLNPYDDGAESASTHNIIICNLKSLEQNDRSLHKTIPDHKIYVSMDYYLLDNDDYHRKNLYAYNQVPVIQRLTTPLRKLVRANTRTALMSLQKRSAQLHSAHVQCALDEKTRFLTVLFIISTIYAS